MKKAVLNGKIIVVMLIFCGLSANARTIIRNESAPVPVCSGNQLSLKEVESEGSMGGHVIENFVFTNISSSSCTLSGYPTFVLLDKAGKVMRGVKMIYTDGSEDSKPEVVTIKPKETAYFNIFYSTGFGYDLKKSPPSSAKIKITAPKTTKAFVLKGEISAYKEIQVSSIRSGLPS